MAWKVNRYHRTVIDCDAYPGNKDLVVAKFGHKLKISLIHPPVPAGFCTLLEL